MSYLSALISKWQLAERKTRKTWFTFSEFGGEEQRCLDHAGCCLHILALRATRVRSVSCWGRWSGTLTWGKGESEEVVETEVFCFVILPRAWLGSAFARKSARGYWHHEQSRWSQPPLLLSNQKEANVQPLVRPTWFTSQRMIIWGSVPTLPPSQAVRPTVPYFLSIELLMDFAPLCPIPCLWICWISKPEVKPELAIIYSPSHTFNTHKNHTTVIASLLIFNRCLCIPLYLILEKKLYTGFAQILSPVRQMRLEVQISSYKASFRVHIQHICSLGIPMCYLLGRKCTFLLPIWQN